MTLEIEAIIGGEVDPDPAEYDPPRDEEEDSEDGAQE